jgi:hypothetical protein
VGTDNYDIFLHIVQADEANNGKLKSRGVSEKSVSAIEENFFFES